jgi:hypothetical protein
MPYTVELGHEMIEKMRAMPPKDPAKRRVNKQGLIRLLAQEIAALQERGYTIEEIVESLHGWGLDITTPTLKSYLQRAKGRKARQKAPPGPAGAPARTVRRSQAQPDAAPARTPSTNVVRRADARGPAANAVPPVKPAAEPETFRSGKNAFLIKDKDSY